MRGDKTVAGLTLECIAQQAVWRNAHAEVSGLMCYDVSLQQVWQVLEGRPEDVATLWERISQDSRHVIDHESIVVEAIEDRRYPQGWGMRYSRFDQLTSALQESENSSGQLLQLMYKSFLKDQEGGVTKLMEEIVRKAIIKNASLDITGWLLYNTRTLAVYQVLEGPPEVVEKIFGLISRDPRHEVFLGSVRRKIVKKREFPLWAMSLDKTS